MIRRWWVAAAAAVLSCAMACARPYPPSGGDPDRTAPQVIGTTPEAMAVEPGWSEPVVIRFDERVSEKGVRDAVLVSPETGRVRVKKGRSHLSISIEGGWRSGQIYRVVVLPVLQDLHGNRLKNEIEVIFSTGPEVPATVVAGLVNDRLTGRPAAGARVEAVRRADSAVYVALSDSAGFFALRHIPQGGYDLRAYQDRNRNRSPEYGEPQAVGGADLGAADTTITTFSLLPNDSTPAQLARAESGDSLQIRLMLDDPIDPTEPLDGVVVRLWHLPDSVEAGVAHLFHPHEYAAWVAEQKAATAPPDTAAPDPTGVKAVAADSAAARPARPPQAPGGAGVPPDTAGPGSEPLPARELVVIPEAPLLPRERYRVEVSGLRNLHGLAGGGGSVTFEAPAPAPAPAQVRPDSAGGAARDTVPRAVPPDSGAIR